MQTQSLHTITRGRARRIVRGAAVAAAFAVTLPAGVAHAQPSIACSGYATAAPSVYMQTCIESQNTFSPALRRASVRVKNAGADPRYVRMTVDLRTKTGRVPGSGGFCTNGGLPIPGGQVSTCYGPWVASVGPVAAFAEVSVAPYTTPPKAVFSPWVA